MNSRGACYTCDSPTKQDGIGISENSVEVESNHVARSHHYVDENEQCHSVQSYNCGPNTPKMSIFQPMSTCDDNVMRRSNVFTNS